MNSNTIAKSILEQIKAGRTDGGDAGLNAIRCWGFNKPYCFGEESHKGHLGGLQFNVRGLRFKGKVHVALNANDTYTIFVAKPRATEYTQIIEGVYCDDLTAILDDFIELEVRAIDYKAAR